MSTMVRTQVYLPKDIYGELQIRARLTGLSMAEQIRQALRQYLQSEQDEGVVLRDDDPIWQIVGAASSSPSDVSSHHDKYLYGWEKDQ
jgi:Arc/MetJ-type ribon-helix-helix transcriptional regulator